MAATARPGLPVTLFVPTGFVGRENTWPELPGGGMPRLPIMGWPHWRGCTKKA